MSDNRLVKLARVLLDHSLKVSKGDKFLISTEIEAKPLVKEIVRYANEIGAYAYVEFNDDEIDRLLLEGTDEEKADYSLMVAEAKFSGMMGRIRIRCVGNTAEMSNVDNETRAMIMKKNAALNNVLINEKKWVLLDYPTVVGAMKAKMTMEEYENYVLNVCTINYQGLHDKALALKELIERTDKVRIVGPGTDISFSIKGMNAVICYGERNLPDGEVYTAPIKNSVNGKITYNVATTYQGRVFENVCFEFKDGKIINASASANNRALNMILDTDEGARYIGEFSFGLNPIIKKGIGNILFDEKMSGSFHFTPGNCYKKADNGNYSAIHWDLVCSQFKENGGGEIYFDDVLIRKDGLFVIEELLLLNPNKILK